nr:MAG TPA: Thymidylate synthase complementing protein [Bacteriophage sp.]
MPNVSNVRVYALDDSIKAAKYPKAVKLDGLTAELTKGILACLNCPTGEGHDNALNGIIVQFDLTFSQKAWVELQRYHFMDFVSSCSTMHKLQNMNPRQQCNRYVDPRAIDVLNEKIAEYNRLLNVRKEGITVSDDTLKEARLEMLYNIPSGFELTAAMTTNYRQLKTIYQQRRPHPLIDWQVFCDFCETLPRFLELTQRGYEPNA